MPFANATLFIFGLMIGSFLNVLIFRLPEEEGVVGGRSHCRACGKILGWLELIPIFSYIMQRGKCRSCHAAISIQYPLVELATGLLFVFAYAFTISQTPQFTPYTLYPIPYTLFIVCCLIVIFVTDIRHFIIPDKIVFPAIAVSGVIILANRLLLNCQLSTVNCQLSSAALSLSGAAFFLALVLLSRGRWMGLGDVKLAIVMGLFLGVAKLAVAMLFAFMVGALVGAVLLIAQRKTLQSEMPFGAFLAPATLAAFFWGDALLRMLRLTPFRW